jgi:hypothetical protein
VQNEVLHVIKEREGLMPHEVSFAFNEPEGVFLAYGFFVLVLSFPMWKLWRIHTVPESIRAFLFSAKGFPYLLLILLGLFWLYLTIIGTYTGFWTLHIAHKDRLMLDYWFPRSNSVLQSQEIRDLSLTTNQRRSKEEVSNQYWIISLVTRKGTEHASVKIYSKDKAKRAIAALEQWAGRPHIPYLKDCSDAWGVVCSTSRVSKK